MISLYVSSVQDRQGELERCDLVRLLERAETGTTADGIDILFERSARHRCTLIRDASGRHWFVKRRGGAANAHGPTLAREISFHSRFLESEAAHEIATRVPQHRAHEAERALIVEGFPDARALGDVLLADDIDSPLMRKIGGFLAMLHSIPTPYVDGLTTNTSPVLTHGHVTPLELVNRPSAYTELLRLLQRAPRLNRMFRDLRQAWNPGRLVHGDFKVDNILLLGRRGDELDFRIVDWEGFGIGDPAWDCAALVGSLYYLFAVHCFASHEPGRVDATAVTRHIEAFFAGYEEGLGTTLDKSRILNWAGYWITHKVIGRLMPSSPLAAHDLAAMHLAEQLLGTSDDSNAADDSAITSS